MKYVTAKAKAAAAAKAAKTPTKKSAVVTKSSSGKTLRFAVAAAYTGDCCGLPHVWVLLVRAADAAAAEEVLRKKVVAKKFTCHDVIALPASPKAKGVPLTAGPSGHHVEAPAQS